MYATSLIMVLATPVLAITLVLLGVGTLLHVGIFDPALGGDPILFQHLFWFYSHPAVYIMILPGMGVVSEIIACFARKPIFGYHFIVFASLAIAILGFLVWGHHMFVSGQSMYAGMVFSLLSFLVAIPSAIKVFNWTATMYKGSISFDTPDALRLGFHWPVHDGRSDRAVAGVAGARRPSCTTPISSSPISTTSWSAAWSWPIWAGFTSGGPRSPAGCIRNSGPSSRQL